METRARKALLNTARSFTGGMDAFSVALGFGEKGLRNRIYELKGQPPLQYETVRLMQEMTNTTYIVEEFAIESGGVFIKLPKASNIGKEDLNDKFLQLHADIGEMSKKYFDATRDNEINQTEKQDLTDQLNKVCTSLQEWMALSFVVFCKKA